MLRNPLQFVNPFHTTLPAYKTAEPYLSKEKLTPEKVKVAYRKFRPSPDEKEFRRKCLRSFDSKCLAVSKPGNWIREDLYDFIARFKVGDEEFQVASLTLRGSKIFAALEFKKVVDGTLGRGDKMLKSALENAKAENSSTVNIGFSITPEMPPACVEMPISCVEEICKNSKFESYFKRPIHVAVTKYRESEALKMTSKSDRLNSLPAIELFLGPEAIWINKDEFPD